jgi:hypothetical protein
MSSSPPLLCFLHGYGEAAPLDIFDALTMHGPLRAGNPAAAVDRFVIVAPQLPLAGDLWYRHSPAVHDIVSRESQQHGCDVQRWYLTGFSFGGNGVFDLALAQPDTWAALWAVDPTRVPERDIARPLWLSFEEIARHQFSAFIARLSLEPADETLTRDHVWTDDGENHVRTAALAYGNERAYDWLLSKRSAVKQV